MSRQGRVWRLPLPPAGGQFTGAALNPARVLGPALVYGCYKRSAWIYVVAELVGGAAAGAVSWPLYGTWPAGGLSMLALRRVHACRGLALCGCTT